MSPSSSPFESLKKKFNLGTPKAPKMVAQPLPAVEDDVDAVPALGSSWSSSGSSSSGTPSPTTPSPVGSPVAYRTMSRLSGGRPETPQDISRFSSPDAALDQYCIRRTSTPASGHEIAKPTPRRAFVPPLPQSTTVMNVALPDTQRPLKGILKHSRHTSSPSRPATAAPSSSGSASPPPAAYTGRPTSSASRRPSYSHGTSMANLALHWQLLPPVSLASPTNMQPLKVVEFDVTKPVRSIKIRDFTERPYRVLRGREVDACLKKQACAGVSLPSMTIRYEPIPGLEINVTASDGANVSCKDVFEAIYTFFDKVMTADNRSDYMRSDRMNQCRDAFKKRCRASLRAVPDAEERAGMRFVDLLEGKTLFLGLKRPHNDRHPDKYWVVDFGIPNPPQSS
ncbi:hypothetical protein C8Q79DRAFT_537836 [Trametes meyenii]|nr:hypothetical protein C8Q79DRAFT_537836 [Trametes meyenii]